LFTGRIGSLPGDTSRRAPLEGIGNFFNFHSRGVGDYILYPSSASGISVAMPFRANPTPKKLIHRRGKLAGVFNFTDDRF
jgi:hypothetical protein